LFFWHFENQHIADKQRTVIWINGGPGCSSEDGSMMEIGPYRLKDQDNLVYNNGSWNEFANLLFVDNPVGTGFSSVDTNSYIHELKEMADQFVTFLEKWFALFPQYDGDDVGRTWLRMNINLLILSRSTSQASLMQDSISLTLPELFSTETRRTPKPHGT
jgi:hypothetical protein